jgi:CheY-like chemotaxis protein
VSIHCSSQAALAAFQEKPHRYDAVITDLNMPDLNGMELAKKISAIRPEVPIILCTGDRSAFTDEQLLASGIGEIVLKPLFKKDLAVLLAKIFC